MLRRVVPALIQRATGTGSQGSRRAKDSSLPAATATSAEIGALGSVASTSSLNRWSRACPPPGCRPAPRKRHSAGYRGTAQCLPTRGFPMVHTAALRRCALVAVTAVLVLVGGAGSAAATTTALSEPGASSPSSVGVFTASAGSGGAPAATSTICNWAEFDPTSSTPKRMPSWYPLLPRTISARPLHRGRCLRPAVRAKSPG